MGTVPDPVDQGLVLAEELTFHFIKQSALFRQDHTGISALKKLYPQFIFQRFDLPADGLLTDKQMHRRLRKAPCSRRFYKTRDLCDCHILVPPVSCGSRFLLLYHKTMPRQNARHFFPLSSDTAVSLHR